MKLLLADDHALFRDALVLYIERAEPGSEVTLAKDFPEALQKMDEYPEQDLILLDLRMPGMDGMDGIKCIKEKYPNIPVALMSGVAEKEDVEAAMSLGAVGYFPKTLSGKALIKGIQLVLSGEVFLPTDANTHNIMPSYYADNDGRGAVNRCSGTTGEQNNDNNGEGAPEITLTQRERQVLSFLSKGASNKEIANNLGLQVVTIKLHVRGVCRKLNATNRTQAALRARELGL